MAQCCIPLAPIGCGNQKYHVEPVSRSACAYYIEAVHYARRWPSVSFAYGLFCEGVLCGVVTYGTPASAPLRSGLAGEKYAVSVLELNRLCLERNGKNEASMLVGRSLQQLPGNRIVVSYADTSQGHVGFVYQACNFLYTGLSAQRTDWTIEGEEHLHGQTIADRFRGVENRADAVRAEYGDRFRLEPRPRKHRYVQIVGTRSFKKEARLAIRYPFLPYPK
jgi:hypothetical protein